jgi:hypothetical protein
MKHHRTKIIITAVLIAVLLGGCTLMSSYFMNEYHFWSLVGNGGSASKTLSYDSRGYTIVMSKGEDDGEDDGVTGYATEEKARADMNSTVFTLTIDGNSINGEDKSVARLNDNAWHIVEYFPIPVARGETYTIKGKTTEGGDFVAEGTLKLRITSWLIF